MILFILLQLTIQVQVYSANLSEIADGTTSAQYLSLRKAMQLGLKRSPEIKKAEAEHEGAKEETREAKALRYPEVNIVGNATERTQAVSTFTNSSAGTSQDFQAYIEATQPIYVGGAISEGLASKENDERLKKMASEMQTQAVLQKIITAYFAVEELVRQSTASERHLKVLKEHAEVTRQYEKIGRARRADRLVTSINLSTAEINLKNTQTRLHAKYEDLKRLLALESPPKILVDDQYQAPAVKNWNLHQLVQKAMRDNRDIRFAQIQLDQVGNDKAVALATDKPSLYLKGLTGYRTQDEKELFASSSEYSALSIELSVPIFSGLSSLAKRRNFEARKVSFSRSLEALKLEVEAAISSYLREYQNLAEQLEQAKLSSDQAAEALRLASADYKRNLISSQDIISIQRTRYDAELQFIETKYSFLKVALALQELTGENLLEHY